MKKIYGVLLVILLTLVMTGCSSNSNKELCENIDKIQVFTVGCLNADVVTAGKAIVFTVSDGAYGWIALRNG